MSTDNQQAPARRPVADILRDIRRAEQGLDPTAQFSDDSRVISEQRHLRDRIAILRAELAAAEGASHA